MGFRRDGDADDTDKRREMRHDEPMSEFGQLRKVLDKSRKRQSPSKGAFGAPGNASSHLSAPTKPLTRTEALMRSEINCERPTRERREARIRLFIVHKMDDKSTAWKRDDDPSLSGDGYVGTFINTDEGVRETRLVIRKSGDAYYLAVLVKTEFTTWDGRSIKPGYHIGPDIPYSEVFERGIIELLDELFAIADLRVNHPEKFKERLAQDAARDLKELRKAQTEDFRSAQKENAPPMPSADHRPNLRGQLRTNTTDRRKAPRRLRKV